MPNLACEHERDGSIDAQRTVLLALGAVDRRGAPTGVRDPA